MRALELARAVTDDAALVVLLSGGASALLATPAAWRDARRQGRDARGALMRAGAAIDELQLRA